ncbi:heparan-alpha-glucosaminide N-acetyltransferase domain-containing protein [Nocardioides solisilvae]|uniref:heparan-alpha-glucosaminide N-acetyltransferase domain-containing protein n=1 Tax=Nocardioides solisilvae TaxID=1542435 RepID=UPI000D744144|nr:heparan-alpha-glucosaminide N-acetyltransferase domain-containing protein [Nocardioides solisilvae]
MDARPRLVGIDVARALALLGMVATHVLEPRTPSGDLAFAQAVAGGRASALFAVLAGLSIALTTGRRRPPRGRERVAASVGLVVRAGLVALVGLALADLDSGIAVILTYYGLLFVCALPFLGLGARPLLAWAAAWAVLAPVASHLLRPLAPERGWSSPSFDQLAEPGPLLAELFLTGYYPVLPWVAYLLAGMALGRADLGRRRVAASVAAAGALLATVAAVASELLTRPADVVRALLADPPPIGVAPASRDELLDLVAGGMFGTTPTGAWQWLLVDAPHSATPFDLLHTIGTAWLVVGAALLVVDLLPAAGRRGVAVLTGAGTATLSLYALHVAMRSEHLPPTDGPDSFRWHVLVLAALGAGLVAAGRRGPLEAFVGAAARGSALVVRQAWPEGGAGYAAAMDSHHDDKQTPDESSGGQVSEVSSMDGAGEEISPGDAVAGAPDQSAGDDRPQEGTAGPDAPPRHGIPEESNESSR